MIQILYSADYELFLGDNPAPEQAVLLDPTERLLAHCDALGIPMTLFADCGCLWWYRARGDHAFPDRVEQQLRRAVAGGHDVQAHIHPHWPFTTREGDRFRFPPERYLLGGDGAPEEALLERAADLLARTRDDLEALLQPVAADYRCLAYRAGGYGLQPGERAILGALQREGYRIDSSLVPGMRLETAVNRVDFTPLAGFGNGWFSPRHGLERPAPAGEGVFEIPVAAAALGVLDRLRVAWGFLGLALRRLRGDYRDPGVPAIHGHTAQSAAAPPGPWQRLRRKAALLNMPWGYLESHPNPALMQVVAARFIDRHYRPPEPLYLSFSCHPKVLGADRLDALGRFHRWLLGRHPGQLRAITFRQAAQQLEAGP